MWSKGNLNMQTYPSYHISGNFHNDLIFAFFAISFTSQNIKCVEIISIIFCYKKLFISQKMTNPSKKKVAHFFLFCKLCESWKSQIYGTWFNTSTQICRVCQSDINFLNLFVFTEGPDAEVDTDSQLPAHKAASRGEIIALVKAIQGDPSSLELEDSEGNRENLLTISVFQIDPSNI